ncbi:matrix metalloproteinase-17 [Parasteatoda tepidariorum]|uniref:matrix metalloproteinase-17 n=1 Tax=Parasteatoda tepidariorum TaxID=114398 RepID=UPI001C720C49|nr:matrix metalloproteinase-2 [Parasteatoda tepidariorum]
MCPNFGTKCVRESVGFIFVLNFDKIWKIGKKLRILQRTYFLVTFFLLTTFCSGLPIIAPNRGNLSTSAVSRAVEYLTKYGYLPPSDPSTGNLRKENELREAIRTMQEFGHLTPTGVVDDATMKLMQRRRCGMPDIIPGGHYRVKRYTIQGQKWPNTNLSWSVKSSISSADLQMVRSQLRKAFDVWSAASSLTFIEVEEPTADIIVSFLRGSHGDGYPFDGEGSILAHAFFPGEGIGGDAHFDAEEKWLPTQPDDEDEGVNLFAVAAHEIGHSLGLSHSSTPGSLMFPYYQVMGEQFTLPKDDADGIRHLYGRKSSFKQPTMPTLPTTTETSTTSEAGKFLPMTTSKPRKVPAEANPKAIDVCNTSIDAISVIRREVFVFKGKHFWRLDMNKTLRSGYPVAIDRFWHDLPADIQQVDALYERPGDTKIVFFSGKLYWLFQANRLEPGYPKPLTDLGLPPDLERIDAAIVWGHNGKTYLFSGKEYWKLDESEGRVELDYPRKISAWRGVPQNVDAAFQWIDGSTYFFKDLKYWKFIDAKMRVDNKGPFEVGSNWFKCSKTSVEMTEPITTQRAVLAEADTVNQSAAFHQTYLCYIIILTCLLIRINSEI